ncbi:DUF805 domain-containing protein [Hyphomonas sp.]|uniref:DUF805 domain-containing protein n=1 Tax=Hyphomonas sp. TaxID=87 RepID=UPI00391ACD41
MDLRFILLETKGRLAPQPFAQGYILLTGAALIITVVSTFFLEGLAILQYVLVFPYFCVFAKRFHDAGLSGWLWLVALFAYLVFSSLLSVLLMPILSPQAWTIYEEVSRLSQTQGMEAGMDALAREGVELVRSAALSTVASFLITSALIGFVTYRLRSEPHPNRHGLPPGADTTF